MSQFVKVGQIWCDKDGRRKGRKFKVEAILQGENKALVKPIKLGSRITKISLNRFKPWKYELDTASSVDNNKLNSSSRTFYVTNTSTSFDMPSLSTMNTISVNRPNLNKTLSDQCKDIIPGPWKSNIANVATLDFGHIGLVVRSIGNTEYNIKIKFDNITIDTWSTRHIGLNMVLNHLKEKLESIRDDFSAILN